MDLSVSNTFVKMASIECFLRDVSSMIIATLSIINLKLTAPHTRVKKNSLRREQCTLSAQSMPAARTCLTSAGNQGSSSHISSKIEYMNAAPVQRSRIKVFATPAVVNSSLMVMQTSELAVMCGFRSHETISESKL
ncbi:unnamed protein product [Lymnaea stagnalis]|uniref:Uncharacterized protein n=1 Tax=Lymnaea stagnalis TaxID=6523 RepID=A0AAV2I5F8_LYMST